MCRRKHEKPKQRYNRSEGDETNYIAEKMQRKKSYSGKTE